MRSVVVLTGSELRHSYFRIALALAPGLRVVRSYCEGTEKSLRALTERRADAFAAQFGHIDARYNNMHFLHRHLKRNYRVTVNRVHNVSTFELLEHTGRH